MEIAPMSHPTDEQLLDYADDPSGALAHLARHVSDCDACSAYVAIQAMLTTAIRADHAAAPPAAVLLQAQQLMAERPASAVADLLAKVTAPARRIIAEVIFDSWGTLAPGLSGVRGVAVVRHLTLAAGPAEFDLRLTPPVAPKKTWSLLGQISSDDPVSQIELISRKAAPVTAAADTGGMFRAELPEGDWDVIMHMKDFVYVLPKLPVRRGVQ
jgi:hypothetical protein